MIVKCTTYLFKIVKHNKILKDCFAVRNICNNQVFVKTFFAQELKSWWNSHIQRGITQIFYWWCYGLFHRSAGKRSARSNTSAVSSAPLSRQHTATFRSENSNNQFNRIPCPIALRQRILGLDQPSCRCSRHYIPQIMDIEYDEFIQMEAPDTQIIVIAVISSLWVCLFVSTTTSYQILYRYSNFDLTSEQIP